MYLLSTCSMWLSFHRSSRPWFLVVLPIGMTCMVAGFVLRFYYAMGDNPTKLSIYLPFYALLLLSVRRPPLCPSGRPPPSRAPRAGLKALLCTSTLLIPLPSTALRLLGHRLHPPAPPRSRHGRRRRLDRLPRPDPLPPPLLRLVGRHHLLRESSSSTRDRLSQDEQRPHPPTSFVERGAARPVAAGQHADALSLSRSRCREEASWLPVRARCPISGPRSCSSASSPRPSRSCSSRSSSWSSAFGCAFILLARFPHSRVQELTRSPARVQLPQQHAPRAAD